MENKGLRFLLSLAIAVVVWLLVVSVVSPESEVVIQNVPVVLSGENVLADRNLIIVSNKEFTVNLKLFGNRVDLNKLTASNITVLADLSQITEPGEHNVRFDIQYPNVVQDGNVEALERDPQYIKLTVAERGWKEVPVKVTYTGSVPANYVADRQNPAFDRATITVSGPISELEKVDHASISVDLTGKTETVVGTFRPVLCAADGTPLTDMGKLTLDVNEIRATIKILKIKQVPIVVEVIPGGGLTENDVTVTTELKSIVVSGNDAALENLEQIVVGQIYLAELMESASLEFAITMPAGVNNETGVTKVKANVELLKLLETREFVLNRISLVNKPGNRHVELVTETITVQIRGTAEELDALNIEDIVVMVDCSEVANVANMNTRLNVVIQIPEGNGAGVVGKYTVLVKVSVMGTGG